MSLEQDVSQAMADCQWCVHGLKNEAEIYGKCEGLVSVNRGYGKV